MVWRMSSKRLDLKEKKFGKLLIEEFVEVRKGSAYWQCLCDCGNSIIVCGSSLTTKSESSTVSCGCHRKAGLLRNAENLRKRPYENLYNTLVRNCKRNNIQINLSYRQFVRFTKTDRCSYCKEPIFWSEYNPIKNGTRYNLDRKQSKLGYFLENLVVCCKRCNYSRGDRYTHEEWKIMTLALREYWLAKE